MLSEFAPARRRSLLLAGTQAGVGVGYGLANVFAQTFAAPSVLGWRWAYFGSFAFAAIAPKSCVLIRARLMSVWPDRRRYAATDGAGADLDGARVLADLPAAEDPRRDRIHGPPRRYRIRRRA
jgi:MFS family permease